MTRDQFRNALAVLLNLERWDLREAGINLSDEAWDRFVVNPHRFFLRTDDATKNGLWRLIEARNKPLSSRGTSSAEE